jgi:hypothetical protein
MLVFVPEGYHSEQCIKTALDETQHPMLLTQELETYRYLGIRYMGPFGLGRGSDSTLRFVKNLYRAWTKMSIEPTGPTNSKYVVKHAGENIWMHLKACNKPEEVEAFMLTFSTIGVNPTPVKLYIRPDPMDPPAGPSNEQLTEPTLQPTGQ